MIHILNTARIKIFHILNIDRAVFFAIIAKIWTMSAGLVTAYLVIQFFTPALQGYYYTFLSLLALQVFAELGLGVVISNFASHEWVKLAFNNEGKVLGNRAAKSRLYSLGRFSMHWYLIASIFLTLSLALGGFIFFGLTSRKDILIWAGPWIATCIVAGLNLYFVPIWSLLEGCNQVANIYFYRFIQALVSGILAWICIYFGFGLWVPSIVGFIVLLIGMYLLWRQYKKFIIEIILGKREKKILNWRKDILPMQWRISLSWFSGYLTFSLFIPILFHYQGPVIAGQMGMTWSFIAALNSLSSSWVAPKSATFAMLIAKHKYTELDRKFWHLTMVVLGVTLIGAFAIFALIYSLAAMHHPFASRLLTPLTTSYFLLATIVISTTTPVAMYLRAHKKEPLLLISIIVGIVSLNMYIFLAKYSSVSAIALAYLGISIIACISVFIIWYFSRIKWHK